MAQSSQRNYFDLMAGGGVDPLPGPAERESFTLSRGDSVGLVLLTPGAPEARDDVYEYLFRQYLDELGAAFGAACRVRSYFSRLMASKRLTPAVDQVNAIGGGAALNQLTKDQSRALVSTVRGKSKYSRDIFVGSYVASRFGSLNATRAISQMRADGVNKIILIPVFPSYASALCDFSSSYWKDFKDGGAMSSLDTTWISPPYGTSGFAQSTSDRIDQALQRYPRVVRDDVHVVFVARWSGQSAWFRISAAVPEPVSQTVARIVESSPREFSFSIGHLDSSRLRARSKTSVQTQLYRLRAERKRSVLIVPVDHVSEQLDSAYRIDVQLRAAANEYGFDHFHVTSAVNCHPSFINGVAEKVTDRVEPVVESEDGSALAQVTELLNLVEVGG